MRLGGSAQTRWSYIGINNQLEAVEAGDTYALPLPWCKKLFCHFVPNSSLLSHFMQQAKLNLLWEWIISIHP